MCTYKILTDLHIYVYLVLCNLITYVIHVTHLDVSYYFFFNLLEYNCFTMLCQFLPHSKVNQPYAYTHPLPLGPPFPPIPPNQAITEHRAELLYSRFPLAIYFTHGCIYVKPNLPIHPTLLFPTMSMSILYICLSIPALQIGSSVPFFQIPHICTNI